MAQNITIAGVSYPDVPSVNLAKTGGGTAEYIDATEIKCQIFEFTLATHQSSNVTLGTLNAQALAHVNDTNFTVAMVNLTPSSVVVNDDFRLTAQNNSNAPAQGSYPVYGSGNRKATATTVQNLPCYYPPNSTDNATGLGGLGKIWHSGATLYYKSNGYFLGAGTYRVIITW